MKIKSILLIVFQLFIIVSYTYCQATTSGNTFNLSTDYIGWNTTFGSPPLYIKTELPQPINFYTNTGAGSIPAISNVQIDAAGLVGIGTATIPPAFQLDVTNEINIGSPTNYYMIEGFTVLQNFGIQNIFCGVGAGNMTLTGRGNACFGSNAGIGLQDGWQNIFIGTNAGNSTTDGDFNIMIGNTTGQYNANGRANTFVGTRSGEHNLADSNLYYGAASGLLNENGTRNTFIGTHAGLNNTVSDNVLIGHQSGEAGTTGERNTYTGTLSGTFTSTGSDNVLNGYRSGLNITTGSNNTFIGNSTALANTTGSYNTVVGDAANCAATLNHQTALGDGAIATTANTVIIGNNYNTGVGLSNVAGGPLRMLHVHDNSGAEQFRLSHHVSNKYTDFLSTSNGDLSIRPRDMTLSGANQQRRVGINTGTPRTTLEIDAPDAGASTGNSGLQFTDLTTASTINTSWFTGAPKGVLSVDDDGKVVLVTDEGSGNTGTCASFNTAADFNFVPLFSSTTSPELCKSIIFNNATGVGVNTTDPQYIFNNAGTAMFAQAVITSPLTPYIARDYPLAVQTYYTGTTHGEYAGIGVFGGTGSAGRDELNIFVDDDGMTCFESRFKPTSFYFRATSGSFADRSMLGFDPLHGSTIIMDNFSATNCTAPVGYENTRLYVESQDKGNTPLIYAAWVRNNSNDNVTSGIPISYGLYAQNDNEHCQDGARNYGAKCEGGNAEFYNVGITAKGYNVSTNCSTSTCIGGEFVARGDYHNIGVATLIEYNNAEKNFGELTRLKSNGDDAEQTGNFVNIESVNERSKNIGYYAKIVDSKAVDNIGGWFEVTNTASSKTYGIYASVPSPTCTTSCSSWAGWFNGPCWSTGAFLTSDSTIKQNVNNIADPLSMLDLIHPKSYDFDTLAVPQLNLPKGTHYGVIAQDLEQSFPQFVSNGIQPAQTDTNGVIIFPEKEIKSVNYNEFIPILIGAVKQQQMQIDSLKQLILSCCAIAPRSTGQHRHDKDQKTEINQLTTIILDQNVPNPFQDETDINYEIPEDIKKATLLIYDRTGHILQKIVIKERGKGTVHVYAPDLSNGAYIYALLADGKVIESKTMVKLK